MQEQHWDDVYRTKPSDDVSWHQERPTMSLRLIGSTPGSVIDVGAGTSNLVDHLLADGAFDVTVLDVSTEALEATRARLGQDAARVTFHITDLLTWKPERTYNTWHDRAVFHFLTDRSDQERYVSLAASAVTPGGTLVLGTFAENGPEQCSGLPTTRHSAAGLAERFASAFELVASDAEVHTTPWGTVQNFVWVRLQRQRPTS